MRTLEEQAGYDQWRHEQEQEQARLHMLMLQPGHKNSFNEP